MSPDRYETVLLAGWDYAVVILVVVVSGAIGLYHVWKAKQSKNTKEFLVANRNFGLTPLIMSMVATYLSPNTMLGQPMETYSNGVQVSLTSLGVMTSYLVAMYATIPVFFRLNLCTVNQYLEYRFGKFLRVFLAALGLAQNSIMIASICYVTALVLSSATGIQFWASMSIICVICIVYSSLGGVTAVIWTDVFQVLVIFVSLFALVIKGTMSVGSISYIWDVNRRGDRATFFRFNSDPNSNYTAWSLLLGNYFLFYTTAVLNQNALQRQMANKSLYKARMLMLWSILLMVIVSQSVCWVGMIIYARYADCDPLLNGQINSRDQIVSLFAMEIFKNQPGLYGIFIAGILATTLSTLSSVLNSVSTVALIDFIRPIASNMSDRNATLVSKIVGCLYGAAVVALTGIVEYFGSIVQVLHAIAGTSLGPTAGVFSLGLFCPWATKLGATVGYFTGLAFGWWMSVGRLMWRIPYITAPMSTYGCLKSALHAAIDSSGLESRPIDFLEALSDLNTTSVQPPNSDIFPLYTVIPLWYAAITMFVVIIVGSIVSFVTGAQDVDKLDSRLISPLVFAILNWLPVSWKKKVGYQNFGIKDKPSDDIEFEDAEFEPKKPHH